MNNIKLIAEAFNASFIIDSSVSDRYPIDALIIISPLMFHCALYIEPTLDGGFEERYCFANETIAKKAAIHYLKTGEMKFWQKHHNKNISIKENFAYHSGVLQVPENAIHQVEWNEREIRQQYPHSIT